MYRVDTSKYGSTMDQPQTSEPAEPLWPRAAASIAVFKGQSVLVARRGKPPVQGFWSLPGGKIEPGETAAAAALRELEEETGVKADLLGLLDVHDVILHDTDGQLTAHYLIAVHVGQWLSGEPLAADDITDAMFVSLDKLGGLDMTPAARCLIDRAWKIFRERTSQ